MGNWCAKMLMEWFTIWTQYNTVWACFIAHLPLVTTDMSALGVGSEDPTLAGTEATLMVTHLYLGDQPISCCHLLLSCSPVTLGLVMRLEAKVTCTEGRKVFLSCEAQSSNRTILHAIRIPFPAICPYPYCWAQKVASPSAEDFSRKDGDHHKTSTGLSERTKLREVYGNGRISVIAPLSTPTGLQRVKVGLLLWHQRGELRCFRKQPWLRQAEGPCWADFPGSMGVIRLYSLPFQSFSSKWTDPAARTTRLISLALTGRRKRNQTFCWSRFCWSHSLQLPCVL